MSEKKRKCPYCAEEIMELAQKCKFCWSSLRKKNTISELDIAGVVLATILFVSLLLPWHGNHIGFEIVGEVDFIVHLGGLMIFIAIIGLLFAQIFNPQKSTIRKRGLCSIILGGVYIAICTEILFLDDRIKGSAGYQIAFAISIALLISGIYSLSSYQPKNLKKGREIFEEKK